MFVLIAYDITDDRRRTKIAKLMEGYGDRVQGSVFESDLDRSRLEELIRRTRKLIRPSEDSVRFYELDRDYRDRVTILGQGELFEAEDAYYI